MKKSFSFYHEYVFYLLLGLFIILFFDVLLGDWGSALLLCACIALALVVYYFIGSIVLYFPHNNFKKMFYIIMISIDVFLFLDAFYFNATVADFNAITIVMGIFFISSICLLLVLLPCAILLCMFFLVALFILKESSLEKFWKNFLMWGLKR